MHQQKTAVYRVNCLCEDYSELDVLELIRLRYELKKSNKFSEGICHLEKAIEAFSSCHESVDSHCQEKLGDDDVQSQLLTPNQYSIEILKENSA